MPSTNSVLQTAARDVPTDPGMLVDVVVLSSENALYESIRRCVGERNLLWRARSSEEAVDMLLLGRCGVLLVDMASVSAQPASLIQRIHGQFPDVVIVVAGAREDEAALARLVSDGLIYRYMHKPLSARRAGMFLGAAIRQYADRKERRDFEPLLPRRARPPDRVEPRYWGISAALIAAVVLAVAVLTHQDRPADSALSPPMVPTVAGPDTARADPVLSRARAALAAGRFESPEGRNALDLYRAVLLARPEHAEARVGLERTLAAIVGEAATRVTSGDREEALRLLQRVLEADPGHEPAQAMFATLQPPPAAVVPVEPAPIAVASDAPDAALVSTIKAPPPPDLPPAAAQSPQPDVADTPPAATMSPPENAAPSVARPPVAKPPFVQPQVAQHPSVQQQDASTSAARAASAPAASHSTQPVRDPLQPTLAMTSPKKAKARGRVFGAPISSGHPIAGFDNRPIRVEPPREDSRQTSREPDAIDASAPVAATKRTVAPTRTSEPPEAPGKPDFIDSKELAQTVWIDPVYPAAAMRTAQEGWVTLEFTVGERGDVRDALITDAEPAGVFDAAALKAVGQWRFEPRVSSGRPVPVRSSVTLRFAVDR